MKNVNKNLSLPPDVVRILEGQANASAYAADAVRQRYEAHRQAQMRVKMAGWQRPELLLLCDLMNGTLLVEEIPHATQIVLEMQDAAELEPALLSKWGVDVERWASLAAGVSASEPLARSLHVCTREFWQGGDRLDWLAP